MFICLMGWRASINCKPKGERCLCGLLLLFPFGSTGVLFSFFPMINQAYFRRLKNSPMMTENPGRWSINAESNFAIFFHLFDWSMYPSIELFSGYILRNSLALGDIDDGLLFVVRWNQPRESFVPGWLINGDMWISCDDVCFLAICKTSV